MKLALLLVFAVSAGCMQPTAPTETDTEGDPTGPDVPAPTVPEDGDGNASLVPSLPIVRLEDCFHLLGFVPMEWAAAVDLLPAGFTPVTWTLEGDQSLAVLEVLFVDCAQAFVSGESVGPAASLWLQPDVDAADAALLEQNNFHAYSAHSNEAVQAAWAAMGRAEQGSFEVLHDTPGSVAVVHAQAPSLDSIMTLHETGVISGPATVTWRVFYETEDEVGRVDMDIKGARGTLGGELTLALAKAPFPLTASAPGGLTSGFGNGHGALDSLEITTGETLE